MNSVLENGVFYAASKLYGIRFEERHDIPVYSDDMRVFELFNEDGSTIGLFYTDFYKRDNKSGGAWMSEIVGQSKLLGHKPVIYNVCNFKKPAEGEPSLISYDDVTTMFHEFGHALHGLLADQTYPSLAGTNVARDFVELPSQMNEHWALYPEVFNNYSACFSKASTSSIFWSGEIMCHCISSPAAASTSAKAYPWLNLEAFTTLSTNSFGIGSPVS